MLELGGYSEASHRGVGERIVGYGIDLFIGVGERMQEAIDTAKALGMRQNQLMHMENAVSAARFLQSRLRAGDVVLIKGAQGMRMERAVKELMEEPLRAKQLLCRQGKEWE